VIVQEDHDFLDLFLLLPGSRNSVGAIHADAGYFEQTFWVLLDEREGIFLDLANDPLRQFRTDAFDHARAKTALNSSHGCRQGLLTDFSFELRSVFWMVVPLSLQT